MLQRLPGKHVRHRKDEERKGKAALIQNRRVMSTNSGLGASSRVTVLGSSAIPQIGQEPGSGRTISGCMGQTYSIVFQMELTVAGSSAMPHFGQAPGLDSRTSGSIGQTYTPCSFLPVCAACEGACMCE